MARIYGNITELIGNTPLVRLNRVNDAQATVVAKLEFFNPAGSVKDRIGLSMIEAAEQAGHDQARHDHADRADQRQHRHRPGLRRRRQGLPADPDHARDHEPGAAQAAARLRRRAGADAGAEGMGGAIRRAEELAAETPNSFIPQQFKNPANPEVHRRDARPRRSGTTPTARSISWSPAWARAARSPAWPR